MRRWAHVLVVLELLCSGCGHSVRRFPLADPMWEDPDRNHLAHTPEETYSGINADGIDKLLLYWLSDFWRFRLEDEAVNVNALDEVPNSSWFQNRIGWFDITPEQAARGACGDTPPLDGRGPWRVINAKPNGANPGFFIEAPDGSRYLLKFDGDIQPTRATGADVIGSKLWWLAGYHTPCNEIVTFRPQILEIAPDATTTDIFGNVVPITPQDVERVLSKAFRTNDGMLRASVSRFVPGEPLGPYTYEDTRADDPNDIIPHEDRRELRATDMLAAWINHIDLREQNTLAVLVEERGRRYVRHYKIDWGDALGIQYPPPSLDRRLGYSYVIDFEHFFGDLLTLGAIPRPWQQVERGPFETFGYFAPEPFVPSQWRGVYQTQAFARRTYRDTLWMLRIMSRITDAHIRAIVATARFEDPRQAEYLSDTLIQRRDAFFAEYLDELAPLTRFRVVRRSSGRPEQSLCFEDMAIRHGVVGEETTFYKMRFWGGPALDEELGWAQISPPAQHPSWSCVLLPLGIQRPAQLAGAQAPADHPLRYGVLEIFIHQSSRIPPTSSVRLHFYDLGPTRGFRLVGIEHPPQPVVPPETRRFPP